MGFMDSLNISASGMTAERLRMDVISNNLANVNTTQTEGGGPFRRKEVELSEGSSSFSDTLNQLSQGQGASAVAGSLDGSSLSGVRVTGITDDNSPFLEEYDPSSPDADKKGYVTEEDVTTWHKLQRTLHHSNQGGTGDALRPRPAFQRGGTTPQRINTSTKGTALPMTQPDAN